MRNVSQIAIAAIFATLSAGPVLAHETGTPHEEAAAPSVSADLPMVKGEVVKIDESAGKIQFKHAAIPNLNMEAMSMVFKANDPAMLKTVKVGDKVNFQADKVNGQLTVMKIEKGK
jgi:Cu(I)/Ag(I) efflux system protein CusF